MAQGSKTSNFFEIREFCFCVVHKMHFISLYIKYKREIEMDHKSNEINLLPSLLDKIVICINKKKEKREKQI